MEDSRGFSNLIFIEQIENALLNKRYLQHFVLRVRRMQYVFIYDSIIELS